MGTRELGRERAARATCPGQARRARTFASVVAVTLLVAAIHGMVAAQTLTYLRSMDIATLDPLAAGDNLSLAVIENVYEGLFGVTGAGTELAPLLATGYSVSSDLLTYTFDLRPDVTFHSGNPFTCADLEYSLKRALVVYPSDLAQPLLGVDGDAGSALGDDATDDQYAALWTKIADAVSCVGPLTARVTSLVPYPFMVEALSDVRVIDSALARAEDQWSGTEADWRDWVDADLTSHSLQGHASGTGAYLIESWDPGVRVVAKANPAYWGGKPRLAAVVYEVVADELSRVAALVSGDADMIDIEQYPLEELAARPGVIVHGSDTDPASDWSAASVWTVYFNQAIAPEGNDLIGSGALDGSGVPADFFSDADARKCFAFAFDTAKYNRQGLGGKGLGGAMAMPPSYAGYDPTIPPYGHDATKAVGHCRAAWGGALWEAGFRLELPYWPGFWLTETVADLFKNGLEGLNPRFHIDLTEVDVDTYFGTVDSGRAPLFLLGARTTLPDGFSYIDAFYGSVGDTFAAEFGYANPDVDALVAQARYEFDAGERAALYGRVGWLGYEDAPFIPLPVMPAAAVTSDRVGGTLRNPMLMGPRWADMFKIE